jgi:hypothetical protein
MLAEFVSKILSLGTPNFQKIGDLQYVDKSIHLLTPPMADRVECSTLQGFVDLLMEGELDEIDPKSALIHVTSPHSVELVAKVADEYGRRRVWARAKYPEVEGFKFCTWHSPESFIISALQHFQRVKIENDDGTFAKDLDYVLSVASRITAERATDYEDDGFAQRVAVKQGVALKAETVLRPTIQLSPYRTFAEIDQVISQFVFRAKIADDKVLLALFDGDGGRWKLGAVAAIKEWLGQKVGEVPVIS